MNRSPIFYDASGRRRRRFGFAIGAFILLVMLVGRGAGGVDRGRAARALAAVRGRASRAHQITAAARAAAQARTAPVHRLCPAVDRCAGARGARGHAACDRLSCALGRFERRVAPAAYRCARLADSGLGLGDGPRSQDHGVPRYRRAGDHQPLAASAADPADDPECGPGRLGRAGHGEAARFPRATPRAARPARALAGAQPGRGRLFRFRGIVARRVRPTIAPSCERRRRGSDVTAGSSRSPCRSARMPGT